jgi:hypothetical protein
MARTICPTGCWQLAGFLQEFYPDSRGERPPSSSGLFTIQIDDRRASDVSSDFCSLSVVILGSQDSRFTLQLENPPLDAETRALIGDRDGKITGSRPELQVEIPLLTTDVGYLRKLAQAFRRIVGRGRVYSNRNWKWVCRRTADSIDRLADRLMEYRRLRRHTPERLSAQAAVPVTAGHDSVASRQQGGNNARAVEPDDDIFRLLGGE